MNEAQAKRLVGSYADMILRISTSYLKNTYDAEDICQTVFLKMLTQQLAFTDPEHEKAWIIRATINACKDHLKSSYRKRTVQLDEAMEISAPQIPESGGFTEALLKLPVNYRLSIYLYYYEGYSVKEIAQFLGKSENGIFAYLSRGRKRLKAFIEETNDER